jgi:hypothetical protein
LTRRDRCGQPQSATVRATAIAAAAFGEIRRRYADFTRPGFRGTAGFHFSGKCSNVVSKGGLQGCSIEEHDAIWGLEMLEFAGGIASIAMWRTLRSVGRTALDPHNVKSAAWSQASTQITAQACAP